LNSLSFLTPWFAEYPFVVLLAIVTLNLLHRLFLQARDPMTFDSWGHLYLTFAVQRSGRGPFKPIRPQVVGAGDFYYPLLPHWTYSHLPNRFLLQYNRLINPLIETAFLFLAVCIAIAGGVPSEWALTGALGYVFTPLWFTKLMIGPRVLQFTTRMFSEVLYPLAVGVLLLPMPFPDWVAVLIGAALFAAVLLGSKFGVQVVSFVTPLIALIGGSLGTAIAWLLAFGLAHAVSRGNFAFQLRQQIAHLRWFAAAFQEGRVHVQAQGRNSLKALVQWVPEKSFVKNFRRLVFVWFARNSVTSLILRAPHLVSTAVMGVYLIATPTSVAAPFGAALGGAAVVYLLTSLKAFLFLGEAERYLSHVSIWSNILFVSLCATLGVPELAWLAIGYGLLYSIAERLFLRGSLDPELKRNENSVMRYLEGLSEQRTIIIYPYHALPPYRVMIHTNHICLFPWMAGEEHQQAIKPLEDYPRIDLTKLGESPVLQAVDTLIVYRNEQNDRIPEWRVPHDWRKVEGPFGELDVFERQD